MIDATDGEKIDRRVSRTRFAATALGASLTTIVAAHLRLGYSFGFGDQAVLMVKGISIADPSAYVNDWFNNSSPQPHWAFDLVTAIGEKLHVLALVYLGYFFASMIAVGVASALLARRWLPRHAQWLSLLIGPLIVFGPISPLGSTTLVLPIAVPHVLGGCLAYLAIALLITDRPLHAALTTVLVALAHVQHGANLAVIVMICALVMTGWSKRDRLVLASAGAFGAVHAVIATKLRGITGNGSDFVEICRLRSPHHCDANSWATTRLTTGWILLLMISLLIWTRRRHELKVLLIATGLPLVGLLAGVWSDRLDVPFFGELAQSTNIYRLVTLILPFAVWAVFVGLAGADTTQIRGPMVLFTTMILMAWYAADSSLSDVSKSAGTAMILAGVTVVVIASGLWVTTRPNLITILSTLILVVVLLSGLTTLSFHRITIGYDSSDPRVSGARRVESATPVGSIVAAPPTMTWLRAVSRRAVIVDCKSVPYGGTPWREYKERIRSLGGWGNCRGSNSYSLLTIKDMEQLVDRYGATHALVSESDPKFHRAAEAGWTIVDEFVSWDTGDGFPPRVDPPAMKMRLFEIRSQPHRPRTAD